LTPILGKMADGILMVVRPGVVPMLLLLKSFFEAIGPKRSGQVVNGVNSDNHTATTMRRNTTRKILHPGKSLRLILEQLLTALT